MGREFEFIAGDARRKGKPYVKQRSARTKKSIQGALRRRLDGDYRDSGLLQGCWIVLVCRDGRHRAAARYLWNARGLRAGADASLTAGSVA